MPRGRATRSSPRYEPGEPGDDVTGLLLHTARGDEAAFSRLYDHVAASVFGLARRVLRDPSQAEEVTQEILVEVWRTAPRFDPEKGNATTWIMTIAHRRAVDRVRSEQSARDRETRVFVHEPSAADAGETVADRMEQQRVRMALESLTDIQREAIGLAYYGGHTYKEVSDLLDVPLPTIKTRIRDGLIRLRDSLGVPA